MALRGREWHQVYLYSFTTRLVLVSEPKLAFPLKGLQSLPSKDNVLGKVVCVCVCVCVGVWVGGCGCVHVWVWV